MRHQISGQTLRRRILLWTLGVALAPLAGFLDPTLHGHAVASGGPRILTVEHSRAYRATYATFPHDALLLAAPEQRALTELAPDAAAATSDMPASAARPRRFAANAASASDAAPVPVATARPVELRVAQADVPLPPPRPAHLSAAVSDIQAQAPASTQPIDAGDTSAASDLQRRAAEAASRPEPGGLKPSAPAFKSDGKLNVVALPPSHSGAHSGAHAGAHTGGRAALPNVIMSGSDRAEPRPLDRLAALAFAEAPAALAAPASAAHRAAVAARRKAAVRRPEFVPARVDRSNFRTLTAAAPTERATTYSAQGTGSVLAPIRAAARVNPRAATVLSNSEVVAHFCDAPNGDLKPGSFSGPAVKALTVADGFATVMLDRTE